MNYENEIDSEISELDQSESLRKDMNLIKSHKNNLYHEDEQKSIELFLEFVTQYNEFINHEPKPFKRIIDKDMIL